ncbi:hypothetical protein QZH41_008607 [Actinostola sp. cb2023]|nr:hypothetical protein QZH41_008607 [Actinostola sp. cb2023]
MPAEEKRIKGDVESGNSKVQEAKDLSRLLELVSTPASKQQLPSISWIPDENQNVIIPSWGGTGPAGTAGPACQHQSMEALALEKFSSRYQSTRNFTNHTQYDVFSQVFTSLVKHRVCCLEWIQTAPPENILRVLICLRMLMRDKAFQTLFFELGGVKILSERLQLLTENYLENGEEQFTVDILKEMTSKCVYLTLFYLVIDTYDVDCSLDICQKLCSDVKQREWMVACGTHKALLLLLSANDVMVLHCSLYALIGLAQSERPCALIAELNCTETLLRILQDYDVLSKTLSANLLRILCSDSNIREQVKVFEGIPICLSLLHEENLKLLWNVVWIIVQLAEDSDSSNDVRLLGGIPLLLGLLNEMSAETGNTHSDLPRTLNTETDTDPLEDQLSLKCALTELVLNDTNGQQIVQVNGVYLLGVLILPHETTTNEEAVSVENLQKSAFRALRLFPSTLFESFIDVGHYVRDLNAYKKIVEDLNSLPVDDITTIHNNILAINQNKAPTQVISSYEVLELLGTGAFGSVYKVRKKHGGQSHLAMKEISIHNPALGKTAKERGQSVGEIVNETTIMKEQVRISLCITYGYRYTLRHPNIVRYHKAFEEKEKLYVIMELIEGAPIGEHFNSLIEKRTSFTEDRVWHIFIQIVLGLRYLHKDKRIVHRDLTPNNIMLGENDKVTITDFGLAKQRNPDASKMMSVVGTILYSCPEVVQNQPYGEKADVWAAGCILYQMCTLKPPFFSSNMLALATKIVEAQYDPIPPGQYSDKVSQTVQKCLTADPNNRPDIVEVAATISDIMLLYMDKVRANEISLEKKLERERKRTQRHYIESTRNMQNYHRLFWASQERYDKLVSLSSSGGAAGLKNVRDSEHETVFENGGQVDPTSTSTDSGVFMGKSNPALNGSNSSITTTVDNSSDTTVKTTSPNLSHSRRVKKELTPLKTPGDKGPKGTPEKLHNGRTKYDKTNDNFAVPKPPGPRKGVRRPLNLDHGLHKSASNGMLINGNNNVSNVVPHSPTVTTPSSVDIAVTRRTQSRYVEFVELSLWLPPTLSSNPQRRIIERFKRALFAPQSSSFNLKSEIKKVIEGSREVVDLHSWFGDPSFLGHQQDCAVDKLVNSTGLENVDGQEIGITYEMIQNIIENVLMESGYYDMSPSARRGKTGG